MTQHTNHPTRPEWTVGDRIYKARRCAGLRLRDLAEPLAVTHATISNWEHDKGLPRPVFLREIAEITGVEYEWLAGEAFKLQAVDTTPDEVCDVFPCEHDLAAA